MNDDAYLDAIVSAFENCVDDIVHELRRSAERISRLNLIDAKGNENYGQYASAIVHEIVWSNANLGYDRLAEQAANIAAEQVRREL